MDGVTDSHPGGRTTLRIFLCGDVMTGRGIDQALPRPGDPELREAAVRSAIEYVRLAERASGAFRTPLDPRDIWGAALELWRRMDPDVRLMNLETAVTTSDDFAPKGINYRMHPDNMAGLLASGVQVCALANNHILDFGPGGLAETLEVLHRNGVQTVGAGRNLAQAQAPAALAVGSARVLFYSVASGDSGVPEVWTAGPDRPGVDRVDLTNAAAREIAARIAGTKQPNDVAIVSIHWGSNWGYQVPEAHRRFAHALIDSGQVSIVHGHSSHHPRPIEVYRDRLILYGCGDFLNDYEGIGGYEAFRGHLVAMYFADIDRQTGALRRLSLAPLGIRRFQLSSPDPGDVAWLIATLSRESRPFGVELELAKTGLVDVHWRPARQRWSPV
jgi:poly-gamma-glutamate capsule biosynthesis protein CapA/YwtB (metallophosphatase superfamily)